MKASSPVIFNIWQKILMMLTGSLSKVHWLAVTRGWTNQIAEWYVGLFFNQWASIPYNVNHVWMNWRKSNDVYYICQDQGRSTRSKSPEFTDVGKNPKTQIRSRMQGIVDCLESYELVNSTTVLCIGDAYFLKVFSYIIANWVTLEKFTTSYCADDTWRRLNWNCKLYG